MVSMATQCLGKVETKTGRRNYGRCRRMTTNQSNYCPQHKHQVANQYPTLVIGTSVRAAQAYAKLLRLDDYIAADSEAQVQGIRIRAVVCTPAYLERELDKKERNQVNFSVFYEALNRFYYYSVPRG